MKKYRGLPCEYRGLHCDSCDNYQPNNIDWKKTVCGKCMEDGNATANYTGYTSEAMNMERRLPCIGDLKESVYGIYRSVMLCKDNYHRYTVSLESAQAAVLQIMKLMYKHYSHSFTYDEYMEHVNSVLNQ